MFICKFIKLIFTLADIFDMKSTRIKKFIICNIIYNISKIICSLHYAKIYYVLTDINGIKSTGNVKILILSIRHYCKMKKVDRVFISFNFQA